MDQEKRDHIEHKLKEALELKPRNLFHCLALTIKEIRCKPGPDTALALMTLILFGFDTIVVLLRSLGKHGSVGFFF